MAGNEPLTTGGKPGRSAYHEFYDAPWVSGLFRPLLIAVLAAGFIAGPLVLLRGAMPWRLGYALPLACAVALEGVYSTLQLGRPHWRDRRGMFFRLGEVVAILILLRLAIWLFSTRLPGLADFWLWLRDPGSFLEDQFVIVGILLLLAWGLAIGVTGDFVDLAIQPDEVAVHESRGLGESRSQMRAFRPISRSQIMARYAARWGWGGFLVVLCAALSRVTVSAGAKGGFRFGLAQVGLSADILAALICYFLAGLLLMSQAQLAVLRGRWYNQEIDVRPMVLRRWHLNSLLVLTLVAGLAALLPIGSTNWLSQVLETIIAFLMRLVYLLGLLFTFLVGLLLYPLRFLFGGLQPPIRPGTPDFQVPPQAEVVSRLPDWLGGALLWIAVALIVGYLAWNYLAAHGLPKGRWAEVLARLRFWWRARWARLGVSAGAAMVALRSRLRPTRVARGPAGRLSFVRLSALPPKERVRYFYLKMVRRAGERGLVRPSYRTPSEFAGDLKAQWPDAGPDVQELTEAFLAARYDRRPIPAAEAHGVQGVWRRVMRALRGRASS